MVNHSLQPANREASKANKGWPLTERNSKIKERTPRATHSQQPPKWSHQPIYSIKGILGIRTLFLCLKMEGTPSIFLSFSHCQGLELSWQGAPGEAEPAEPNLSMTSPEADLTPDPKQSHPTSLFPINWELRSCISTTNTKLLMNLFCLELLYLMLGRPKQRDERRVVSQLSNSFAISPIPSTGPGTDPKYPSSIAVLSPSPLCLDGDPSKNHFIPFSKGSSVRTAKQVLLFLHRNGNQ